MAPKEKAEKVKRVGKRAAAKAGLAGDVAVEELTSSSSKLNLENNRSSTGVLTSEKNSRDVKIELYSLRFFSQILINESTIELNYGRRYGLIGPNGSGKSTFLESLFAREAPIPEHIDIYLLNSEYPPTEMTALEAVIDDAEKEIKRLEQLMEDILTEDPESQLLDGIYERIEDMDPATFETRAAMLLDGLGFSAGRMKFKTKDLSGGWRMRVALARALFVKPTLLILDEPTNHLDLGACVWLEEYLAKYDRILLLVSHSQDFLNTVCTNIIELDHKKHLKYYSGNYDAFIKTKEENEVNQLKAYKKQQDEITDIKKFIASCGTFANLVKQAKSRQKILDKMEADGLIEPPPAEKLFDFFFNSAGPLPPPVLAFNDMSFSYSGKTSDLIYKNLEFGVDTESRIALVGPNGAGKSTLLKLMSGVLSPTSGTISRHSHLKIGVYSQHSADQLDLNNCAVDYLRSKFPALPQDMPTWRQNVGRFGLTGNSQLCPIAQLSDGQKARIVFAELSLHAPNVLLLDEPTNALDIETIDTLARAINTFQGGVVLVSHDFRLIRQVAKQIWVCENGSMNLWESDITAYKNKLRKGVQELTKVNDQLSIKTIHIPLDLRINAFAIHFKFLRVQATSSKKSKQMSSVENSPVLKLLSSHNVIEGMGGDASAVVRGDNFNLEPLTAKMSTTGFGHGAAAAAGGGDSQAAGLGLPAAKLDDDDEDTAVGGGGIAIMKSQVPSLFSSVRAAPTTMKSSSSSGLFAIPTKPATRSKEFSTSNSSSRQRSKSLTSNQIHHLQQPHETPIFGGPANATNASAGSNNNDNNAKPLLAAFHSTGILSRKGRVGHHNSHITPETPIKHKKIVGSIWNTSSGGGIGGMVGGLGGTVLKQDAAPSMTDTPVFARQRVMNFNTKDSNHTPNGSHSGKPPPLPFSAFANSPFQHGNNGLPGTPSAGSMLNASVTSSHARSISRLHRSPLKETPTKNFKRPHQEHDSSPTSASFAALEPPTSIQRLDDSRSGSSNFSNSSMKPPQAPPSAFSFKSSLKVGVTPLVIPGSTTTPSHVSTSSFPSAMSPDVLLESPSNHSSFSRNAALSHSASTSNRAFLSLDGAGSSFEDSSPMQPPSKAQSNKMNNNLASSPVVAPKEFFSRLVKDRKPTNSASASSSTPIPIAALVSRHWQRVDATFFNALEGIQPDLDNILALFSSRASNDSNQAARLDLFESRFELISRLGSGAFADAYKVMSLDDGLQYAIKKTRVPFMGYKDALQKLSEVKMLLKVQNFSYCVSIKTAWIQFGFIYIQMELCSLGSLSKYLEDFFSEVPLMESQIWRILADLIRGIVYIHQKEIVHLDIKPGNIFIASDGTLKIGDFGLATKPPVVNSDLEGDRAYLAPESLHSGLVSYPADIFSLGMILLEMAANIILPQNGPAWVQIREGDISAIDLSRHSQMLIDFIRSMLNQDPAKRPSAGDLLKHPKIASFCSSSN